MSEAAHRSRRRVEAILLLALIAVPLVSHDTFLIDRLGRYFLFAAFAVSVDLIWGYGGMFTFGHATFFGGGGYLVGVLTTHDAAFLPVPLWAALIGAVVAVALFALALSYFVFSGRGALRGVEFAVVTLAIAVAAERLTNAGGSVTGGQNGILMSSSLGVPGVISLQQGYGFYALAGLLLLATYVGVQRFLRSRSGLILRGIRENEDRIDLLGYDVPAIKRRAFVLSAAIAALAGAVFYVHEGIVSPSAVGVGASTLVLLWVVLGGRGTLIGPIVGAILLPHLTATLSGSLLDTWLVVVGVILVAVILVLPSGIFGFLNRERGNVSVLTIDGLTKSFRGFVAVDDVSLELNGGELRGLIGANGAGKSTLLHLIYGRLQADHGSIRFGDTDVTHLLAHERARLGMGLVFQVTSVFGDLTIEENLLLGALPKLPGTEPSVDRAEVERVLELIELADVRCRRARHLSHGQRRWLEIGMVLLTKPKLLLLDEPTSGMTRAESRRTASLLRELQATRAAEAMIVVEHNIEFIRLISDRVTVMHRGEVLADGTIDEVQANPEVQASYLGRRH